MPRLLPTPALLLVLGAGSAGAFPSDGWLESSSRAYHTGDAIASEAHRPEAMTCADFDGDGDLDLALAHDGNNSQPRMCVLRNLGDGSFGAPVSYPTIGETADVTSGDLDGDGDVDLAFAQSDLGLGGNRVLVFRNQGDGTFGTQEIWSTGGGPTGIVAFDADQDGDLDLATANREFDANDLSVLYNDGAAHFGTRVDLPVPNERPYSLAAGDLDGDGFPELVATVRGGSPALSVFVNDGLGGFGPPIGYPTVASSLIEIPGVELADVDLDGDLDVLYTRGTDPTPFVSSVALYRNLGNGVLGAAESLPTTVSFGGGYDFALADVTQDGWPDILAVGYAGNYGYVMIPSLGNGQFGPAKVFRTGEMARAICAGDVDGDGDADVMIANGGSLNVSVHKSEGGTLELPGRMAAGAFSKESDIADIDNDGDLDIVTCDSTVYVLRNLGGGNYLTQSFAPLLSVLDHPKLRDMNGDGYVDLLMLKNTTIGLPPYGLYTALNQGDGTFGPIVSWYFGSAGTGGLDTFDADQDGDLDVVITEFLGSPGQDQRKLYILFNDGTGSFAPPTLIYNSTVTRPWRVLTADVDGDGDSDIVTAHGDLVTWLNDGNGAFGPPIVSATSPAGAQYMVAGDFDGDGVVDIASAFYGATSQGQAMGVMRGHGDGSFSFLSIEYGMYSLQYTGVSGIDAFDADGDGDLDVVAGAYGADDVALFLNHGDGTFASQQRFGVDGNVTFVRAADMDADGFVDVVANMSVGPPLGSDVTILRGRAGDGPVGIADYCLCAAGSAPCGNGDGQAGCANSTGAGARLAASGSVSVTSDDLVLTANQLPPNLSGIVFMGPQAIQLPFGDGLRCVGAGAAGVFRFPVRNSGPSGTLTEGPIAGYSHAHFPAVAQIAPGQTWRFQCWYRDPQGPCGTAFNLSQGLTVSFQP